MQVISSFNLKRMKKFARWCCSTKISKTNLKTMISLLLKSPKGCQGCQKNLKDQTEDHFGKLESKLNKSKKTFRKQGFFDNFCSILMVFHSFLAES